MMGENYMFLAGEEYEFRRINALEYISAIKESEKLAEKYGDGSFTASVLRDACLVAKGAYISGEKKFSTGEEALEAMSVKEIFEAAELYVADERASQGGEREIGLRDSEHGGRQEVTAEETEVTKNRDPDLSYDDRPYFGGATASPEGKRMAAEYDFGIGKEIYEDSGMATSMREISDFFERDCRRHDSGFDRF